MRLGEVVCGNCLDVMRDMPSSCVDLIVVDYPYESTPNKWDKMPDGLKFVQLCNKILKGDRALVMTGKQPSLRKFTKDWDSYFKFHHEEIWVKQSGPWSSYSYPLTAHENVWWWHKGYMPWNAENIGEQCEPYISARAGSSRPAQTVSKLLASRRVRTWKYPLSIYFYDVVRSNHPTEKPVALYERLIAVATQPGDVVFDPFVGSGASLEAALKLNCRVFGCDILPEFVAAARYRLGKVRK